MIVNDTDIEIKKFKMFAEKADSEQKIVELCKKYLKHKGIDVDHTAAFIEHLTPREPMKIYVGMTDIHTINSRFTIDGIDMSASQMSDQMMYARKHVLENITVELLKANLVEFNFYKRMDTYQTELNARLHVWRDPNVKR